MAFEKMFKRSERNVPLRQEKFVEDLFSQDPVKQNQISHIEFLNGMQNSEIVAQIVTAITLQHQKEMADYGSSKFTKRVGELKDRKLLLKLINKEITLDQFITRLNCIE